MYGSKAQSIYDLLIESGIIDSPGHIKLELLGVGFAILDKSSIGNLLQEWLGVWLTVNRIYHRSNKNSQMPPDFYLNESDECDWLEIKSFDYETAPNFDVANFDAYTRDLIDKPYRLDADYLIFGYLLNKSGLIIKNLWLKKVWEICCPSNEWGVRTQVKQGKIYNIRPYNFKSESTGFQPFKDRKSFTVALGETRAKYDADSSEESEWFNCVKESYITHQKKDL